MRHYCVFAIRRRDADVLGYCRLVCGSIWSKDRVCVMSYDKSNDGYLGLPAAREWYKGFARDLSSNGAMPASLRGKSRMLRRSFTVPGREMYKPCGRSMNEYAWKCAKDVAAGCEPPTGYEAVAFRVGSRHCPAIVDLSERAMMDAGKMNEDWYKRTNAKFSVNAIWRYFALGK